MNTWQRSTAIVVLALTGMPCHAAVTPSDMVSQVTIPIVQARPNTGSRIRRNLPQLTIPATEAYAKLTPEQRAAFRAMFKDLADADEPAYPVEGLLPVANSLVFALADGEIASGDLFVTVHVDENGDPLSTSVYATPSQRISREAANALMKIKYKPGVCSGKPCASEFPFTAKFE